MSYFSIFVRFFDRYSLWLGILIEIEKEKLKIILRFILQESYLVYFYKKVNKKLTFNQMIDRLNVIEFWSNKFFFFFYSQIFRLLLRNQNYQFGSKILTVIFENFKNNLVNIVICITQIKNFLIWYCTVYTSYCS